MAQAAGHLVGRADELGSLERIRDELNRRRPGAIAVEGEPGIGKPLLRAPTPGARRAAPRPFGRHRSRGSTCRSRCAAMPWTNTSRAWS